MKEIKFNVENSRILSKKEQKNILGGEQLLDPNDQKELECYIWKFDSPYPYRVTDCADFIYSDEKDSGRCFCK